MAFPGDECNSQKAWSFFSPIFRLQHTGRPVKIYVGCQCPAAIDTGDSALTRVNLKESTAYHLRKSNRLTPKHAPVTLQTMTGSPHLTSFILYILSVYHAQVQAGCRTRYLILSAGSATSAACSSKCTYAQLSVRRCRKLRGSKTLMGRVILVRLTPSRRMCEPRFLSRPQMACLCMRMSCMSAGELKT